MAKAVMQKTPQEEAVDRALAALDAVAGQLVTDDAVLFQGDKMVLPERFRDDLDGAIDALEERRDAEETEFNFSRTFPYRPYDGAAAFHRAVIRVTGMSPAGVATVSFFGKQRPAYKAVAAGPNGETTQVPWGKFSVSMLEAEFNLGADTSDGESFQFVLSVTSKQKHRKRVDALFMIVEDELEKRSIYRGKALSGDDGIEMGFFDPYSMDRAKIVYNDEVMEQLEANVWAPIRYPETMREMGLPIKRAVLLEGPNGTGKTSAGVLTAQVAVDNGWTFIRVAKGQDPKIALTLASQYAPAVVWYEDIDDMVAGQSRNNVSQFMDVLDNVQNKNAEIIAVFTSNFPEKIEKGVLRPGRIDAVIHVGKLDADGTQRLIEALMPEGTLDANIDWEKVTTACRDFMPAFLSEVTGRAIRYGVVRTGGARPEHISTTDLIQAAEGLEAQLRLMDTAKQTAHGRPALDEALIGTVGEALLRHKLDAQHGEIAFAERNGTH